jgi:hypothetical protein
MLSRTLVVLACLTWDTVPVNPDNAWITEACDRLDLGTFDRGLALGAGPYQWLLAEILTRLQRGDIAGLSLVDFIPPGVVLALWHALPQEDRRYLRAVFGTAAITCPEDDDRLEVLDRLVAKSAREVAAADQLLDMVLDTNSTVDQALAELGDEPSADAVQAARALTQDMLAAVATGADPRAWLDEEFPEQEMPPQPKGHT